MDNREANQQQRTAQGLRSGQMTSGEAARTNANQGRVDQQVNREQNHNSQQIHNENHNNARVPPPARGGEEKKH